MDFLVGFDPLFMRRIRPAPVVRLGDGPVPVTVTEGSVEPDDKIVYVGVHDGQVEEREDRSHQQAPDDGGGERLIRVQSRFGGESDREHRDYRDAGRHQDRTQPVRARPGHGLVAGHAPVPILHDHVDHQHGGRDIHARQDDDAEQRHR